MKIYYKHISEPICMKAKDFHKNGVKHFRMFQFLYFTKTDFVLNEKWTFLTVSEKYAMGPAFKTFVLYLYILTDLEY